MSHSQNHKANFIIITISIFNVKIIILILYLFNYCCEYVY